MYIIGGFELIQGFYMGKKVTIEIIYRDENILVINKPTGISVTGDRSGKDDIIKILQGQLPDVQEFRLVHRLDKDTSGVMVLAQNLETQSVLSSAFEKRLVGKVYLAIVSGYIDRDRGTVKAPLARKKSDQRLIGVNPRRGKPAVTRYEVLADFGGYALVAAYPETGRTHQIRVHMLHRHIPLAVDPLYGGKKPLMLSEIKQGYRQKKGADEKPLIDRLTLHAYSLELPETEVCRKGIYIAKLDKKFTAAIKMLTRHNPRGTEAFEDEGMLERILGGVVL